MVLLILVSVLWAFSFGLTKGKLAGIDAAFISTARLGLALLVFLPFLRWRGLPGRLALTLAAIGSLQFGVMYLLLNASYRYLQAHEVVLFTLTTPILVTLIADAAARRWHPRALAAACSAVVGTAIVALRSAEVDVTLTGLLLVQGSNAAFASGQVWYQRVRARHPAVRDRDVFALLYAGATAIAALALFARATPVSVQLNGTQVATLVYLGVVASGLGFFLWNVGATRVGSGTLAVMNNAKVPLGVACSLLFFNETAPLLPLVASLAVLGFAVWLAGSGGRKQEAVSARR